MLLLDASLRISAVTMLLLISVLCLSGGWRLLQARLGAALSISLAGMLITTMPMHLGLPDGIRMFAWFIHLPNTVLLWMFSISLFQDGFKLKRLHWSVFIAAIVTLVTMRVAMAYDYEQVIFVTNIINRVIGFGILAHLIWTALAGRRDDLIESRRRTRLWFTLGIAVASLLIISSETLFYTFTGSGDGPYWFSTARTAIAWPLVLFGFFWFTRLRRENFLFETVTPAAPRKPSIDPRDADMHSKLIEMMESGIFTEQGLTIGNLAQRISVPEHQLRALINQGMGFRNFSAFLNTYRIAYAKELLSNTSHSRLPILTIAMESGYNSLAPFNRAFKSIEGVTPRAYRQRTHVLS